MFNVYIDYQWERTYFNKISPFSFTFFAIFITIEIVSIKNVVGVNMENNILLLQGVNKYQIDKDIATIIDKYQVDELSLVRYDAEETLLDDILNDCETIPFLSEHKIVIINNPMFLSSEKSKIEHNIDRFMNYINNPNQSTILIINAYNVKLDKKRKINKLLLKNVKVMNYDNITEFEATNIILNKFKEINVKISHEVINELISRVECDAGRLYSELDKIAFYADNNLSEITLHDIRLLISEPIEHNIFHLTNNIIDKNVNKSIQLYHKLLKQNEEPIVFSAILANNFHHLYLIKQYQKKSYSEIQLKNILKIHPYQLKKLYLLAKKIKEEDIVSYINALNDYDYKFKSGKVDKYLGFELFILNM